MRKASIETTSLLTPAEGNHLVRMEVTDIYGYMIFATVAIRVDTEPPFNTGNLQFAKLASGSGYSTAIATNGTLWTWGKFTGDGTNTPKNLPIQIGNLAYWSAIAAGNDHVAALTSDGTLWTWGGNSNGQLGDGTTTNRLAPVQIGTDTDWKAVGAGNYHTVAIKTNGTLWAWGSSWYGQLGTGTRGEQHAPVQIGTDANWAAVAAGVQHTVTVKSDGTLWAWGNNSNGQVGDATTVNKTVPTQIGTDRNWAVISAGFDHTVALKSDGSLWAWGGNGHGQLGDGTTIDRYFPTQIGTETNWTAIVAGNEYTVALKSDGSLWAWGYNGYYQIGDGTALDKHVPIRIGTDANWTMLSAGDEFVLALKTDGSLWSWGWNDFGQLGDRTTQPAVVPHQVNYPQAANSVIMINSGANTSNTPSVTLSMDVSDRISGVAFMQFSNDGMNWSSPEPYATSGNWTLTSGDGLKTVYGMFQDVAGNWSPVFSSSITLDSFTPVVAITSPVAGFTINSTPLLTYTASVGTVVVKVDGIIVSKVSGNTLDALAAGSHTVRVEATNSNNYTGYAEVTFTVVNITPTVTITSPTSGLTNNKTPTLTYTASDGTVVVKVDGIVVNKVSGNSLEALADGGHTVRVEATDAANNTGFSEVTFVVDTTPPNVSIVSPVAGITNNNRPPLIYSVSDGAVVVKVDGIVVNKLSGNTLDALANGSHTVRVESTDIFARTGFAEVTFAVDTTAASNDDTNPYCIGEAAYPVGPSSFTTGISVPTADNAILIASPTDQATINSTNIIVKGAMDTTVPVYSVLVVVSGNTGTAGYLAQVNGNYFAAKVQVSSDTKTITAIATDQTGTQHQASVSVSPMIQSSAVDLTALPDIGIPTPKQSGPAMFNSILSSAAITNQVASYAWDFAGNGIADLTCVTHATVTASYQQPGLYFAQVTITDTMGSTFTDTTIVNVLARETLDNIFKPEWNAIKAALNNNDITTAINHVAGSSQYIFQQQFNALALAQALPQFAASLSDISLANVSANFADYEFRTMQNGITYSFQVLFTRDTDGVWRIKSF